MPLARPVPAPPAGPGRPRRRSRAKGKWMDVTEGLREEDLPDDVLDVKPAQLLSVFVRTLIVHDDEDSGDDAGEYDVRFGVAGDDDLVGNRASARWRGSVRSGEEVEVLGWIGPVSVSEPDGLLLVGVAGHEDDFLVDDVVLGGIARLGGAENWGIDRWWRTINGAACDLVFAVVRTPDEASRPAAPVLLDDPTDAPGPAAPEPDDYLAVFG